MKKHLYHFMSYASIVVLIILSGGLNQAHAQEKKEVKRTIIINDGDTIINGKNLKDVSKAERERLRKEFKDVGGDSKARTIIRKRPGGKNEAIVIERKGSKEPRILKWSNDDKELERDAMLFNFNGDSMMISLNHDSLMKGFRFKMAGPDSNFHKRIITLDGNLAGLPRMFEGPFRERLLEGHAFADMGMGRNNSQSFSYSNTDKDGISTRMNIRIFDPGKEQSKKISGSEDAKTLTVDDLTLFPNFSSGKLTLSFNLNTRANTEVKVLDSGLKPVYTDKQSNFSGSYTRQLSLPKNGVYYLVISQGNNWFIRKMIKE